MTAPKKVVVVDDEPDIRQLLETVLRLPEFEVAAFGDPREALAKLPEIEPDLIVCDVMMPVMDGPGFFQAVKRSPLLKDVPFIFLSVVDATERVVALLDAGADDFVSKPFTIERLVAKIRATLRLADRMSDLERQPDALSGRVGKSGTLPLLKFCEDHRLTGRLLVEEGGESRWADFLGGEIVQAGGSPELAGEDPLDVLLSTESGTYRVEQKPLDPEALRKLAERIDEAPAPAAVVADRPPPIPQGRLSLVEVRGGSVQVQTEAENRPQFTVTTIVARGGKVVRKTEAAWQHPLQRREDLGIARAWIDRQHARVVEMIRVLGPGLAAEAPAPVPTSPVDASLLAWTASFIGEQVREHLGSVMTVALLRRTHRATARQWDVLRSFRVGEDGRVAPESAGVSPSADAVSAVAAWSALFLKEAAGIVARVAGIRIRHVTRMMEADLDKCGFYAAFDDARDGLNGEF
jgi:CheY-like chemotaxis protein